MTSTPLRNACSCGPMPTPPNTAAAGNGRVHGEIVEVPDDLRGQLTGRRQHQRAGDARRAPRFDQQALQDRQQKCGRLAAAGHCRRQQIAPVQTGGSRRPESRSAG